MGVFYVIKIAWENERFKKKETVCLCFLFSFTEKNNFAGATKRVQIDEQLNAVRFEGETFLGFGINV